MNAKGLLGTLILGLAAAAAGAQSGSDHDLRWSTIDGGGGNSQGPTFAVAGTLGQADAGGGEGGAFSLQSGFWPPWAAASETPTPVPSETPTPMLTPPASSTPTPTSTPSGSPVGTPTTTPPGGATHTPTPPPAETATPTGTSPEPTGMPTLTATPVPGDVNRDYRVDSWDLFYFGLDWQESAAVADPRCNAITDTIVDERDLLFLLEHWRR